MAAGSGANLNSTTLEGLALESIMALQARERVTANNPNNRNFIAGSYNSDTGVYSGTFQLPVTQTIAVDGSLKLVADEYLT